MSDSRLSKPLVRPATPADAEALGRLGALLVRTHYDFDPRRFLRATASTPEDYASFLGEQLGERDVVVLVAEQHGHDGQDAQGGQVMGYAFGALEGYDWMSLRGPAGVIHDLIVDPEYRGRGVGQALLEAMIEALTARRAPRVILSTAERNEAAQRFFERAGFRRTMVEMTRELT